MDAINEKLPLVVKYGHSVSSVKQTININTKLIMGCRYSKPKARTRSLTDITGMADGLPEPSPPTPTDPRLPLSARQVFKLKKSWKGIKRCMAATGVEIFVR